MTENVYGFTPKNTPERNQEKLPFFEAVSSKIAPGLYTSKSIEGLQNDILDLIQVLGGARVTFREGDFGQAREGYLITFRIRTESGDWLDCREPVAAFPCQQRANREQAKRQALYAFREYLHAELAARHFRPGYNPFVMHVVMEDGHTLAERVVMQYALPSGNGVPS